MNPLTKNMEVLPFARRRGTQDEQGCACSPAPNITKRYEGGEQSRLWRWCEGDDEAKLLTDEAWTKRDAWAHAPPAFPWSVFISDKNGVANVWSMKLDGSETQITHGAGWTSWSLTWTPRA